LLHPTSCRLNLILSFHLCVGLPYALFVGSVSVCFDLSFPISPWGFESLWMNMMSHFRLLMFLCKTNHLKLLVAIIYNAERVTPFIFPHRKLHKCTSW
jgi:hypothetical protein